MKNHVRRVAPHSRNAGFTLIELLTVIAIIAILASISFAGVTQYLAKAKESQTIANMESVTRALSEYAARTENSTGFPPAYGFVEQHARETAVGALDDHDADASTPNDFVVTPYTAFIGLHSDESTRQIARYGTSYDLDGDGSISLMEYLPVGEKDAGGSGYRFSEELYLVFEPSPSIGSVNELAAQQANDIQRPFVYVPFNSRQLQTVRRYWRDANDEYGATYDEDAALLAGRMFFPPANYDGFVLIGNGPGGDNGGVVAGPPAKGGATGYHDNHVYHVTALRIAFLATRDWDNDELLDFSYEDRKRATTPSRTPDLMNGYGAFIKVVQ